MGRHSAPGDDEDDQVEVAVLTEEPAGFGRHARRADPSEVAVAPAVAPAPADPTVAVVETSPIATKAKAAKEPKPPKALKAAKPPKAAKAPRSAKDARAHSTAGDLALVAHHSDVRNRCLAGLIVPFVLYVAVMLTIGATGRQTLLWIFIPLITAGVLVGVFLDSGHKRHAGESPTDAPTS